MCWIDDIFSFASFISVLSGIENRKRSVIKGFKSDRHYVGCLWVTESLLSD